MEDHERNSKRDKEDITPFIIVTLNIPMLSSHAFFEPLENYFKYNFMPQILCRYTNVYRYDIIR